MSMIKYSYRIWVSIFIVLILLTGCSHNTYSYLSTLEIDKFDTSFDSKCTIAIIDTGINSVYSNEHQKNIIKEYNVLEESQNVTDDHGHGTEMTSIILGDEKAGLIGINPNAYIMVIKAIDGTGKTDNSNIAKAIEYLLNLDELPDIINLSLGSLNDDLFLKKEIKQAIDAGIIVVAAVGDYNQKDILYPAAHNGVVSVQAIDMNNNLDAMSNTSKVTTLSFPGVDINVLNINQDQRSIQQCSGSSVATALASGYFSLFISNCKNQGIDITYDKFIDNLRSNIDDNKNLNYNTFVNVDNME